MEKAKRARKAETPRQPSLCLRLRAPYLYPDPTATSSGYSLQGARASLHGLRLPEFPCAVQDFRARAIETHHVVPARHGRQAVGDLAVAVAELDDDRAIRALLRGNTVQGIGVVRVPL